MSHWRPGTRNAKSTAYLHPEPMGQFPGEVSRRRFARGFLSGETDPGAGRRLQRTDRVPPMGQTTETVPCRWRTPQAGSTCWHPTAGIDCLEIEVVSQMAGVLNSGLVSQPDPVFSANRGPEILECPSFVEIPIPAFAKEVVARSRSGAGTCMLDRPTEPAQDQAVPRRSTLRSMYVTAVLGWWADMGSWPTTAHVMPRATWPASPTGCMPAISEAFQ